MLFDAPATLVHIKRGSPKDLFSYANTWMRITLRDLVLVKGTPVRDSAAGR
jgi:hypothetical protein